MSKVIKSYKKTAAMKNPYTLNFGKEPLNLINRTFQEDEIFDDFISENPVSQIYMITGLRGSGKTVALTSISKKIKTLKDWTVIDLNSERDMLKQMAAELSNKKELLQIFKDAKLNLSLFGVGIEIDSVPPIKDEVVALGKMLKHLSKHNKKILVTIDEVATTQYMKEFVSQFQIFMRKDFKVFLLMTGLYENIYELQNEKTLTFLYRTPKIDLKPLNQNLVAQKYRESFSIDEKTSFEMAKLIKGYPFAFQVLGYLCFKNNYSWQDAIPEFDALLEEYVYEKIWSELSAKDKLISNAICQAADSKIENIRAVANIDSSAFSVYRKRLLKKGIVVVPSYGHLEFTLPRFKEFIERN